MEGRGGGEGGRRRVGGGGGNVGLSGEVGVFKDLTYDQDNDNNKIRKERCTS